MTARKLALNLQPNSLKANIAINYVSQIYSIGIGLVMSPIYLARMGPEAFGLVGFFTMMTAWFQLLDMGLTPMLAREVARFRGGAVGPEALRSLLRVLEIAFVAVGVIAGLAAVFAAHGIATHWLTARVLAPQQVIQSVMLMGLTVPLRWISGLYRGVCNGFERQVWLGWFTIVIATLRFVGILAIFATVGTMPTAFFAYQLCIAALELAGLFVVAYLFVPRHVPAVLTLAPLKANLRFSLMIAFGASVWVATTQMDKLVLSKVLTLSEYGIFSIGVMAASVINALNGPLSEAVLPRLTRLAATGDMPGVSALYSQATQLICVIVAPPVAMLAFFAEPILTAWTRNPSVAHHAAPILCLYAVGNGLLAITAFPYYLQSANGDLRLHVVNNILLLVFLIPGVILAATHYGGVGAGSVWVGINLLALLFWIPIVHARFLDGSHMHWLLRDVGAVVAPVALAAWLARSLLPLPDGRWQVLAVLALLGCTLLTVAATGSSTAQALLKRWLLRRRQQVVS